MFERLGRLAERRYVWIIVAWLALAGVLRLAAPDLHDVVTSDVTAFLTADAQSVKAAETLATFWPGDDFGNSAAIVFGRTATLTQSDLAYFDEVESWLNSDQAPDVVERTHSPRSRKELADVLLSRDRTTALLIVQFTTPPFEPVTNEAVAAVRSHIRATKPDGVLVYVTGNAGVGADQLDAINTAIKRTTAITLVLVVLILLWVYRSPVTPLVPLMTIGIAFSVSLAVIALLADRGMQVSSLVETFLVVIVLGAGTDYCLFIVSRFREEVARTHEYRRTLVGTVAVVGAVIASSASTVFVGFSAQGVARFGMFRTTGPALAIAIAITLFAGLTLTPALMRAFGRSLFWPAHPELLAYEGGLPELEAAASVAAIEPRRTSEEIT